MENVRIFIVEDDPLMTRLYGRIFQFFGYEVENAFNGEEALKRLQAMKEKPTLILLDIIMPKLSGFEVLRELKKNPELKNIPVVILSNLAGQADAEKALSIGAVMYLVKSQYEPKEIVEKVKEIISAYTREKDIPEVKTEIKDIDKNK